MRRAEPKVRLTRREFAVAGALTGAGAVIGCHAGKPGQWDFLGDVAARTLAALCDQIIPADGFPSASQAGVVNYIDRQLARHHRRHQAAYLDGLDAVEAMSRKRFGTAFHDAAPEQQLEIALSIEKDSPAFFGFVRQHTMEGYYGSPRHGGNRDAASWRMLGLDEPPLRGRAQYDLQKGSGT